MSQGEVDVITTRSKKALVERMLGGELTHHLGYPPGGEKPAETANHRNGTSGKTVLTDDGPLTLDIPRDRDGTFAPQLIGKHERRFASVDDKILALYARGPTVREIQAFLAEMYAVEVSPDVISTVTDAVHAEVTAWQARPLEPMCPVVFFDALRVKIRDDATVRSKAVYLALAILIAVTDGLQGMSEALAASYPATTLQTCIVHLLRHRLEFAKLEGAEAAGGRAAAHLHGAGRRRRGRRSRRLRGGAVGATVSHGRGVLATARGCARSSRPRGHFPTDTTRLDAAVAVDAQERAHPHSCGQRATHKNPDPPFHPDRAASEILNSVPPSPLCASVAL